MASHAAHRRRRYRRRRSALPWVLLLVLVFALIGGGWYASRNYVMVNGMLVRRDSQSVDLSGKAISPETYEQLQTKLPETEISWGVPIGGGRFSDDSESITLQSFSPEDLESLRYFTRLRFIDAAAAPLTPEQFEQLRQAAPDCSVRWSVPIGDGRYPSDAESIAVSSLSAGDLDSFRYFTALKTVDGRSCPDVDTLMVLGQMHPELSALWQVSLGGVSYDQDAAELRIEDASVTAEQTAAALRQLPAAALVQIPGCGWSGEERLSLAEEFPEIRFQWPVTILGRSFQGDEEEISFAGQALSAQQAREIADWTPYLPLLRRIDLTGCGVGVEDALAIHERIPDTELVFDFDLCGVTVNTMDTLLDLSNIPMTSTEPVERVLPLMPHLEKVDMSDCGFSDEEMDDLNKRYEDVRFVWTIHIVYYKIRTDAVSFRASSSHYSDFDEFSIKKLNYCTDMVVMDMGHRMITSLEFLNYMPNLKYLVLMQCHAEDLSPIGSCKNMIWLELNMCYAADISPLVGATALKHLNITYMPFLDAQKACDTLCAMPWLQRLWYSDWEMTPEQLNAIRAANPELMMHCVASKELSCENPWRQVQDYYDMRDIMNMFYMDEQSRINYKIIDGVRYELDPEFLAQQGDTSHDFDRG